MGDAEFVSRLAGVFTEEALVYLRLGDAVIRVSSNAPDFDLTERFGPGILSRPSGTTDFELRCISTDRIDLDISWIASVTRPLLGGGADESGATVCVVGRTYYLFGAGRLESLVWAFFTRFFLTAHSFEHGALHLKAAAVCRDKAILLVGASGAGKTYLLSRLCDAGADFITNTHSVLSHGSVIGVRTKLGLRPDDQHLPTGAQCRQTHVGRTSKHYVDPAKLWRNVQSEMAVDAICIVDHRSGYGGLISSVGLSTMLNYCEQFALPINCYKLDDELFEFFGRDPLAFSKAYADMKVRLRETLKRLRKFRISADLNDPDALDAVISTLFGPP